MARRRPRPHRDQLDLLTDWQPSQPVKAFAPDTVRGASLAVTISKGVGQALKGCGRSREDVARMMTEYLDEKVSVDMLNAYASEAKSEHVVNIVKFIGLLHATGDRRLLELIAAMFDWAVIERRYLPAIAMAEALEARSKLDREIDARRYTLKRNGVL